MLLTNLTAMSTKRRADYYRERADDALRAAERATDPGARASFLLVANSWLTLANHSESIEDSAGQLASSIQQLDRPSTRPR